MGHAQPKPFAGGAAFYDVDGTLISANVVNAFGYYAVHQPSITASLVRSAATIAQIPLYWAADKLSRKLFNETFYKVYEGQSEDRLIVLAEDMFEDVLKKTIFKRTRPLIEESRRAGCRQVVVSGALDFVLAPLCRHLGIDDVICNRLEFVGGYATGKLQKPFVGGASKAQLIRDYATRNGIDLARSWAYSDSFSDYAMLAVVGHPTAVNPDLRLRAVARSYDWPILEMNA
jgi:HAD superfamily hydrolase (TIGR01490 family)